MLKPHKGGRDRQPSCPCMEKGNPSNKGTKDVPRTHCSYFVNVCLWQWVNAYGISEAELEAYEDQYLVSARYWEKYAGYLSKSKNWTDGKFLLVWYGAEERQS